MPDELTFARQHRDRISLLTPRKQEALLNFLFIKFVKPRLRNQNLTLDEEDTAKISFKRSFMRERGAQLPKEFGKRRPVEKGLAAIGGPIARTMGAGFHGINVGMGELGALLANLGIRPSSPEEAREAWREHSAPLKRVLDEFGTMETFGGKAAETVGGLIPSALVSVGVGAPLRPLAAAGRLGATAAGAAEAGAAFGAYTGELEDVATGALIGGGLSTVLPFIPRAIAGVRGKVRQFRGKPPVAQAPATATELSQALAGEKTKSTILNEISIKRVGKPFAELTEQEASKFGPSIMGEYRAAVKVKTAMSPRERKEFAKAVEAGKADIEALKSSAGLAGGKALASRGKAFRAYAGRPWTELEKLRAGTGESIISIVNNPSVAVTRKAGIPVPKPAPPPAPQPINPAEAKAMGVPLGRVNEVLQRQNAAQSVAAALGKKPTPAAPSLVTKQVTQATETGQALREASNAALTLDERIQAISAIKPTQEDFVSMAADQIRDKYNTLLRDGVNSVLKTVSKITDAAAKRKYQTKLSKAYLGKLEQIESQTFVKGSQKAIGREKMARLRARAKALEQRLPGGQYGVEIEAKLQQLRAAGVEIDDLVVMKLQSGTSVDELLEAMGKL